MTVMFRLSSDLGDQLRFASLQGEEMLGSVYQYALEAVSTSASLDLRAMLGTGMAVSMETGGSFRRHFHGLVMSAENVGEQVINKVRYCRYRFLLVPRMALLRFGMKSHIYKDMSSLEIICDVIRKYGGGDAELRVGSSYARRDYCVQYRESHLDFISRLMEEDGIYYYFEHSASGHVLVLADAASGHATETGFESIPFVTRMHATGRLAASIGEWSVTGAMSTGAVRLDDHDYLRPGTDLSGKHDGGLPGNEVAPGVVDDQPGGNAGFNIDPDQVRRRSRTRWESLNATRHLGHGLTDAAGLMCGRLFSMVDHPIPAMNREYLVTTCHIHLEDAACRSIAQDDTPFAPLKCTFHAIPSSVAYRSPLITPRPLIHGLHTALVHGDTDGDVVVDAHGRVQVSFFWGDPGSCSCPVRVASPWAGDRWGSIHLPRVGHEVVVSFLEGNPDRPLIIGSVYNQDHMPPYRLPDHKSRSGIVSRSMGGGVDEANEIRFEDRKGKEELYLHAQRDLRQEAENDRFISADRDAVDTCGRDLSMEAGRDRKQDIGRDDTLSVGRRLRMEALDQIELSVGPARLLMKRTGEVQITGTTVKISGLASTEVSGGGTLAMKAGASMSMVAGASVSMTGGAAVSVSAGAALTLSAVGPAALKGLPPMLG